MTARPVPRRHWRSHGDEPLPTGREALDEPFSAFPSWFLRITCDRCGKVQMVNESHEVTAPLLRQFQISAGSSARVWVGRLARSVQP
jgi:hypothetical protein